MQVQKSLKGSYKKPRESPCLTDNTRDSFVMHRFPAIQDYILITMLLLPEYKDSLNL